VSLCHFPVQSELTEISESMAEHIPRNASS
jgi:hypothetical protein